MSVDDVEELGVPLRVVGGEPRSGPVFAVSLHLEEAGAEGRSLFENYFTNDLGTAVSEWMLFGLLSFGRSVTVDIHGAYRHVLVAEDGVGHAVDAGEFNAVVAEVAEEFGGSTPLKLKRATSFSERGLRLRG